MKTMKTKQAVVETRVIGAYTLQHVVTRCGDATDHLFIGGAFGAHTVLELAYDPTMKGRGDAHWAGYCEATENKVLGEALARSRRVRDARARSRVCEFCGGEWRNCDCEG